MAKKTEAQKAEEAMQTFMTHVMNVVGEMKIPDEIKDKWVTAIQEKIGASEADPATLTVSLNPDKNSIAVHAKDHEVDWGEIEKMTAGGMPEEFSSLLREALEEMPEDRREEKAQKVDPLTEMMAKLAAADLTVELDGVRLKAGSQTVFEYGSVKLNIATIARLIGLFS